MSGPYNIIYADPPWHFNTWAMTGNKKSACQHYDVLKTDRIAALPIRPLANEDAALFLWVVQSQLPDALRVINSWGFTFKTVAFAWIKCKRGQDRLFYAGEDVKMGLGYHTRAGFEQCWLATRGRGYERISKAEPQVVFAPLREHSRKPDEIADAIVRLCGDLPRIELFARTRRSGWDAWGNETDKFSSSGLSATAAPSTGTSGAGG